MKVYLTLLLLTIITVFDGEYVTEPAFAREAAIQETIDSQDFQSFDREVQGRLGRPASDARQSSDPQKAIPLYEAVVSAWRTKFYESPEIMDDRNHRILEALLSIANTERALGNFDQAARTFLRCHAVTLEQGRSRYDRIDKDSAGYLPLVADAYKDAKQFDKAENIYFVLINLEPKAKSVEYRIALARVYEAAGDFDEARRTAKEIEKSGIVEKSGSQIRSARVYLKHLLQEQKRPLEAEAIENQLNDRHCPICGSESSVVPISYGLPVFPYKGTNHLGGCAISQDSPQWWCNKDEVGF